MNAPTEQFEKVKITLFKALRSNNGSCAPAFGREEVICFQSY